MINTISIGIALIIAIMFMVMLSRKLNIAYPIILVIGGLAFSFIPGMPVIRINPEMIFMIFLPPLLFEAAWNISWKKFWQLKRVILSFAFLFVALTAFAVAVVSVSFIPGFTLAMGLVLGAIISPPDAVLAANVFKTIKVPKNVSTIVEGESLLNDATSLLILKFALITVAVGNFSVADASLNFITVISVGVFTGVAVGLVFYAIHKWFPTDADIDTVLTLTAPYVMYLIAEYFHASGVIAVVCGGLFLSSRKQDFLVSNSRLAGKSVWSSFVLILNGLIFVLIGLQLPIVLVDLGSVTIAKAIGYGLLVSFVLITIRIICALGVSQFTVFMSRFIKTVDKNPGWKAPLLFAWSGMRGVVSLAAALSLPVSLSSGELFPQRNLILFITFIVILVTIIFQGLTLPILVRVLNVRDSENELSLKQQHKMVKDALQSNLPKLISNQSLGFAETTEGKLNVLRMQRLVLFDFNKIIAVDEEVISYFHSLIDIEEESLRQDSIYEDIIK